MQHQNVHPYMCVLIKGLTCNEWGLVHSCMYLLMHILAIPQLKICCKSIRFVKMFACMCIISCGVIMIKGSIKWPGWALRVLNGLITFLINSCMYFMMYILCVYNLNFLMHIIYMYTYNIQAKLWGYMIKVFNGRAGHCVCKVG